MNDIDAIPSSDKAQCSQNPTADTHGYFVPAILVSVIGIIVFATLFEPGISQPVADVTPYDVSGKNALNANNNNSPSSAIALATQADVSGTRSTASDHAAVTSKDRAPEPAAEQATAQITGIETVAANKVADYRRSNHLAGVDAPLIPSGLTANRLQMHHEIIQARRRAYQNTVQMHQQHLRKLRAYRAEVLRRIEHDRRDRYRRMQGISVEREPSRRNAFSLRTRRPAYRPTMC